MVSPRRENKLNENSCEIIYENNLNFQFIISSHRFVRIETSKKEITGMTMRGRERNENIRG